jgi:hypothetical protein
MIEATRRGGQEAHLSKPVPTIDHVVVNVRDQLDDGAETYGRLGFTLTPRGYHSLGSANHLAIFGTDYLELIGVLSPNSARAEILADPCGLNGLVFGTEDSAAVYASLQQSSVPCTPPNEFSRPVELPDGTSRDAVFRTVHIQPEVRPGRLYFCHHFTRDLVWRDEWRHHANGAVGVVRAVIASDDPARLGGLFGRMFGGDAVSNTPGGVSLAVGVQRFDVLTHEAVADQWGVRSDRQEYMAGLTLRTRSLAMAESAFAAGSIAAVASAGRLLVPPSAAMGCTIEFVA